MNAQMLTPEMTALRFASSWVALLSLRRGTGWWWLFSVAVSMLMLMLNEPALSFGWTLIVLGWYLTTRRYESALAGRLAAVLVQPLYRHADGLEDTVLAVAVMQATELKDRTPLAEQVAAAAWAVAGPDGSALSMECSDGHAEPCGHRVDQAAVAYWRALATSVDRERYPAV